MSTTTFGPSAIGESIDHGTTRVAWGRVGLFYGIALGMVSALAFVLSRFGARFATGEAVAVFQLIIAFLYMPMPLVAGLVVERVAGRPTLIRKTWAQLRANWKRILVVSALSMLSIYALDLLVTFVLGNLLHISGIGQLVFTVDEVVANMAAFVPKSSLAQMRATMPPVPLLMVLGGVSGLVAGFSINGLFAFGEEYGWRGVLADELKPLGRNKAALLTGVMWGLWHAPIIVLGFNYGQYWLAGIGMMAVWVVPLSFLLARTRLYTDSVLPAAIIHGAYNASAGFFLFFVAGRHPLVAVPVGLAGGLAVAIAAVGVWWFTRDGVAELEQQPGTFAAE